jgi:uncharacterized protein with FMN-binding domain
MAVEPAAADLSVVPYGLYEGNYKVFPVDVEVAVSVEGHRIVEIELLKHTDSQGGAVGAIVDDVVAARSLDVDTVSGATCSSQVILKAIEAALRVE